MSANKRYVVVVPVVRDVVVDVELVLESPISFRLTLLCLNWRCCCRDTRISRTRTNGLLRDEEFETILRRLRIVTRRRRIDVWLRRNGMATCRRPLHTSFDNRVGRVLVSTSMFSNRSMNWLEEDFLWSFRERKVCRCQQWPPETGKNSWREWTNSMSERVEPTYRNLRREWRGSPEGLRTKEDWRLERETEREQNSTESKSKEWRNLRPSMSLRTNRSLVDRWWWLYNWKRSVCSLEEMWVDKHLDIHSFHLAHRHRSVSPSASPMGTLITVGWFRWILIGDIIVATGALLMRPLSVRRWRLIREAMDHLAELSVVNGLQFPPW